MVQTRRLYSHLLYPTGISMHGGFEGSMGDADTSYARRSYRTAPQPLRRNNLYYNNNEQRNSNFYDGLPPQRRPGFKYYRNQAPPEDEEEEEFSEVIDLGSPKLPRHIIRSEEILEYSNQDAKNERANKLKFNYKPNPRLYPGPQRKPQRKHRGNARGDNVSKTSSPSTGQKRGKSVKKRRPAVRRFVPNPRLYRPPQRRVIPPSAPPKQWTPPDSRQSPLDLDTASKVAMQLAEKAEQQANRTIIYDRNALNGNQEKGKFVCNKTESAKRQIINKKKETTKEQWEVIYNKNTYDAPERPMTTYKLSQKNVKFKMNVPGPALESGAPPEVLTEFLAAIMRGEYGVALQYCRMILKFEPQNTTAQSFYPLLQQKYKARKALSGSDESTATVMRANLHPEGYAPKGSTGRRLDNNYSEPSTASLSSTGTPLSRPSTQNWPKSPTISVSIASSRKFDAPTPLKNTSKVSFSEDMANISLSRTPSLEKLRSMFTHSLINSTNITPHL